MQYTMRMQSKCAIFIFRILPLILLLCLWGTNAKADTLPSYVQEARSLLQIIDPAYKKFFSETQLVLLNDHNAPLARFQPPNNGTGIVALGTDLDRYKDEYTIITSIIPRDIRPDFMQYMTVMTALSLANEYAHFLQYKNKSMNDFFTLYSQKKFREACALYELQQHVSDIVMLDHALKIHQYFSSKQQKRGQQAVSAALDKMEMAEFLPRYHDIILHPDNDKKPRLFIDIRTARLNLNIENISWCSRSYATSTALDKYIVQRARSALNDTYLKK